MRGYYIFIFSLCSLKLYGQDRSKTTATDAIQNQLHIPYITKSDNDIDLRIIARASLTSGGYVLWIRKQGQTWKGTRYDYSLKFNDNHEVINEIAAYTVKKLVCRKSWDSLWLKLEQHQILELPDQDGLKLQGKQVISQRGTGYERVLVMDGTGYEVVIRVNDTDRNYSFHEPCSYLEYYKDSKELMHYCSILSILKRELKPRR